MFRSAPACAGVRCHPTSKTRRPRCCHTSIRRVAAKKKSKDRESPSTPRSPPPTTNPAASPAV
eukprot:3236015-Pleurochrysis_carterae.AAC.1